MADGQSKPGGSTPSAVPAFAADQGSLLLVILGFSGMVLGQFMAILDIQIVAASLSQIQAGVGASYDEISRIQTAYLMAEVVSIPLASYLSRMWSTRRVYLVAAASFVVASLAAGLSSSPQALIIARIVQGFTAGAMIPQVFAAAMTVFPPAHRITAQVVGATAVTAAPMLGPILGGYITEYASWRWIFFVNVPSGALIVALVGRFGDFDRPDPSLGRHVDWAGLSLLAAALSSALFVLEDGARRGWFDDPTIVVLAVTSTLAAFAFVWRELTFHNPIVSLRPFRDGNFALGFALNAVVGVSLFGGSFVLPLFLGAILRYSSAQVGTTLLVSGAVMFLSAPLAGRLIRRADPRLPLILGFALTAVGTVLGVHITDQWGFWQFAGLQSVRSAGVLISMVAASQMCVSTIPGDWMKDASGLVNLVRNIGGAFGIAMLGTILGRQTVTHETDLANALSVGRASSWQLLDGRMSAAVAQGSFDPEGTARHVISQLLHRQAQVLAFGDLFFLMTLLSILAAVLVLAARPRIPRP